MTKRVKICGLTRLEDALLCADLGAWALGFIFYSKSPRSIQPVEAKKIIRLVRDKFNRPPLCVGVFVNETHHKMRSIYESLELDAVQLHGDESPKDTSLWANAWKAIRVKDEKDVSLIDSFHKLVSHILIESSHEGYYGGTGQVGNWQLARKISEEYSKIILSGGLNPGNINKAILEVNPYACDLSSGVESAPGIKDHNLIKKLFEEIENENHTRS